MHLQENIVYDLDIMSLKIMPCMHALHHVTYVPAKFEVSTFNSDEWMHLQDTHYLTLTLGSKVT